MTETYSESDAPPLSGAQDLSTAGAVLTNEIYRCACGNEVRQTGSWRVMRGTNIRCASCGLPMIVYGPTIGDIERQRGEALAMLKRFVSPSEVLRAVFRGRCEEVSALLARMAVEIRKPYSLMVHRAPRP